MWLPSRFGQLLYTASALYLAYAIFHFVVDSDLSLITTLGYLWVFYTGLYVIWRRLV